MQLFKGCIRRRLMPKCYAKYGFSIGVWERDGLFICLFIYFSLFLYTFCYIYKLNIYIYIYVYTCYKYFKLKYFVTKNLAKS